MSNTKAARSVRKCLEAVAEKSGVSVEEVRREIEIALTTARANSDPNVQAFWASVPHKGEIPTSEEVIVYIAGMGRGIFQEQPSGRTEKTGESSKPPA